MACRIHPALVAIPSGAWPTAPALDVLDGVFCDDTYQAAADATLLLGNVSAVPTVAAGLANWVDTYGLCQNSQRKQGNAQANPRCCPSGHPYVARDTAHTSPHRT